MDKWEKSMTIIFIAMVILLFLLGIVWATIRIVKNWPKPKELPST